MGELVRTGADAMVKWTTITLLTVFAMGFVSPLPAGLVGLWEFEDGAAPGTATVGNDLIVNDVNGTIVPVEGLTGSDGAVEIGVGDSFSLNHDIAPNGGSSGYVNQFTVVYDLFLPTSTDATWRSLLQTTTAPDGNDGDYFVSTSNMLGVSSINYTEQTLAADAWYRIVFSADIGANIDGGDPPSSFLTTVTDTLGSSWTFRHASQDLDGRHSLYSTANDNIVHFFADNDGEDNLVTVTNLALFDVPLTQAESVALGPPGAMIPEPSSFFLLLSAILGLLAVARRR
jgi:hypothetical protein